MKKIEIDQSGFGVVELVLVFIIVGIVSGAGWYILKSKQNANNSYNSAASASTVAKSTAKKKTAKTTNVAPETNATTTSSPPALATPQPAATSKATAFTAANCNGDNITVYVSNKNGAEASYHPPGSWQVVKTYAYGESIQVLCHAGEGLMPEYVLANDAYIKSTNLSPTKP